MAPKAVHPRGGNLFICNGKVEHGANQIAQETWDGQHIEVKVLATSNACSLRNKLWLRSIGVRVLS